MHWCQGTVFQVSAQLFQSPPLNPPAASSPAIGHHGDPSAGEGAHLCWGLLVGWWWEAGGEPFPGVSHGSGPALHAVSCQAEGRYITMEKLDKECTTKLVTQCFHLALDKINFRLFNLQTKSRQTDRKMGMGRQRSKGKGNEEKSKE